MTDESVREVRERIVREHFEAETRLDFDAALATFERPRYELIGTETVHDGPDEVAQYYRQLHEAFPDQRYEIISLRHADDAVIAEFWLSGTSKGGQETPGRAFKARMMAFFIFEGTGLVCERVYFDAGTIARQVSG